MKKNISINLQGIIFHIEEDGYEQLSRYLASIRTYFSTYEGHEEIVEDIEARIAEIFSARLSPGKQVISKEDVEYLTARMGSVSDFEVLGAMEEEIPNPQAGPRASAPHDTYTTSDTSSAGPRRLFRDVNRKVVAGVSAGLANYLNVDPLWIRLFFVLFVLLGIISAGISAAMGVVLYVVLWIAMPENAQLPETNAKKLFRDPEDKKLAGVASGIAKYFGVDVSVVRILFLVSIFLGGFGVIAYIVLWVSMPEAVTLTERMQMQGDPVTLVGIEKTLKDNLNMKDSNGEETPLAKVILLPIRLISQLFSWLGTALGPLLAFLITAIRIGAGVILLVVSIGLTIALFSTLFVALGLVDESQYLVLGDFPASVLLGGFPRLGLVAGFFVGMIPLLLLIILAVSLLVKRIFLRPILGWSMFGVWLVSLFTMAATIGMHTTNFRRTGEVITSKTIPVAPYSTLTLDAYDTNTLDSYDTNRGEYRVYFDVRGHSGSNVEIIQRAEAKGRTEDEAKQNARMISYRVLQQDSVLRFDNNYEFKRDAKFRHQELSITIVLPQNKPLRLTRGFTYLLPSASFAQNYSTDKIVRNTWQANGNQLECLTCATDTLDTDEPDENSLRMDLRENVLRGSVLLDDDEYSKNSKSFDFDNFSEVNVSGPYHVQLLQGNSYSVRVRSDDKGLRRTKVEKLGQELRIGYTEKDINLFEHNPVLIQIVAPDFRQIELSGAIKADIGTIQSDELRLNFSGAIKSIADLNVRNLKVDISGACISEFRGQAENFELDATGAGMVDAEDLKATSVDADVTGASVAEVYATTKLRAQASGASRITYKGNPSDTVIDSSGPSSVKRR
ncbi:PspC domain-containing protein [Pontibacter sp. E15-1]|uniref:PspC domain-containing protein n=1 Tax=Pontibacter sp. E15-1 TaxID=2919918 RepID=UPI001F4F6C63|nr:PspC domain-containing protein [Pontibacter sp. E15-1]MCJ8164904.1 PspC domain-containing protein [Pontibacter sp. E15-1]